MAKFVWITFPVEPPDPEPEPDLAITTTSPLTVGTENAQYSVTLQATGGTTPYAWTLQAGSLPTGISLSPAGILDGTPSVEGTFQFTLRVTDSAGSPAHVDLAASLTLLNAATDLQIVNTVLTQGTVGVAYTATLTAINGAPAYTFAHVSGKPTWMAIASNGAITGTPTVAAVSSIVVSVTDTEPDTVQKTLSLTIVAALSMTTTSPLASGTSGTAYSVTLAAAGGTTPYTWSIQSGALPTPLTLHPSTGVISGTPNESGVFAVTVRVADNAGSPATVDRAFNLTVAAAPAQLTVVQTSIPGGKVGVVYPQKQMQAVGGTTPYTWAISAGALPTGLAISSTGLITGTPTVANTFQFTIRVTDNVAATAFSGSFTVVIAPADVLTITTSALPIAALSTAYSAFLVAANNTGSITWAFVSGKPAWLNVNAATGELTGTAPGVETTYTDIVVSATDSLTTAQKTLSLLVTAEGPHTHFDTYKVHANIWKTESLRSQQRLNAMNSKGFVSQGWTYVTDPDDDDHPLKQDAAKLTLLPRAWVRDRLSYPSGAFKYYDNALLGSIGALGNEGTGNERNLQFSMGGLPTLKAVVFTLGTGFTSGKSFTLTYPAWTKDGVVQPEETTGAINWALDSSANIDAALEALTMFGAGEVSVVKTSGQETFTITYAHTTLPPSTVKVPLNIPVPTLNPTGFTPTSVAATNTSMTIVHEMWWDERWQTHYKDTLNKFKCNFLFGTNPGGESNFFVEHGSPEFSQSKFLSDGECSTYFIQAGGSGGDPPARVGNNPYRPTGEGALPQNDFAWPVNKWMRVFIHWEWNVPKAEFTEWAAEYSVDMSTAEFDVYHALTIWGRQENGELVRAYYRVPVSPASVTSMREWRWAFDVSGNNIAGACKHKIDLGDIGPDDSFTITVPAYTNARLGHTTTEQTTAPILYAAAMGPQLEAVLNSDAFTAVDRVSVKKESSTLQIYSLTYHGSWSNQTPLPLVTINPTGFTPGAVTVMQIGRPNHSITEIFYVYARNALFFRNLPFPNEADTAFFAAPRGGDGRV
jgi:hypothetical protein